MSRIVSVFSVLTKAITPQGWFVKPIQVVRQNDGKKGEVYGYDAGKKVKGCKQFALVDTLGLLIAVMVLEASCPERVGGAAVVLEVAQESTEGLAVIWADQGFRGANFARVVQQLTDAEVNIICRQSDGFEVLPKHWIVERRLAWWNYYRRLSKDYERLVKMSEAMIYGAMIHLMLRRLGKAHEQASQ